jgi:alkylation response protein AidB-like acyl-CoA dehydrogenase
MLEDELAQENLLQAVASLAPALMKNAAEGDPSGRFPSESLALLQGCGLSAAPLPCAFGGAGLNEAARRLPLLQVLKHIGRGDLVVGRLFEGHVNALQLIFEFGTPRQQREAADAACSGLWFGVWNTQGESGLRLVDDEATQPPERAWRLLGSKTFASGAGHITRPLVTAALPHGGWQMIALRADSSWPVVDRSFWQPLGMRGSASHRAGFDGMTVPRDWLIGQPGDYLRDPGFNAGSVRFAAVQLGGAEALLDETRRFVRDSGRGGDPYQRLRLGEMAMWVESGNLWLTGAARHVGDVAYAQMMRSAIEQIGLKVMQLAERSVGARGLMQPEPFERLHRDLTHYLRQAGPDAALAQAGADQLARTEPSHRLWNRR